MRTRKWTMMGTAIALIAVGSGCNPDKNKLYFKPEQGATRTVDTQEAWNMSMKMAGMSMSFGSSTDYTFAMTAQQVDEAGNAAFDVTIKSVAYEITGVEGLMGAHMPGGGGPQLPGIAAGDDPLGMRSLSTSLKAAEGQSFTITVSRLGEVTGVSGANTIAEKAASSFKPSRVFGTVSPREIFVKIIGDDAMKRTMSAVFTTRPDRKLNPGDTWQEKDSGGNGMVDFTAESTYTLKDRSAGVIHVDVAEAIELKPAKEAIGGIPGLTMNLSGPGTGSLRFEEASGWLSDGVSTASIPGNMSATLPGFGNMSIPIEASYKTSVKSYPA